MTTRVKGDAGLGLFLQRHQERTSFGHDGADEGFQALLIADREGGFGAAVMVNSDNGIALGEEILRGIENEYEWGYLPPPVDVVKLPAADLEALSGRYQINGDDAMPLSVAQGRLLGRAGTPQEFELHAVNPDRFVRKDRPIVYEVERGGGGGVTGIRVMPQDDTSVVASRVAAGKRFPSEDLAAGRMEEALAGYRKLFTEKPSDPGVSESRLNNLGYQLAAGGELPKAVAILRLNTELYPGSSNTYDSLAEVSLAAGDRAGALTASRKVLEVLPADSKADEAARAQLRANAQKRIRELSDPAGSQKK
ncbi:MAG: serine hydrolase [Acidobacteriota bacterium]|nr:serine hydrolase [Acidobacteriota bacterium]